MGHQQEWLEHSAGQTNVDDRDFSGIVGAPGTAKPSLGATNVAVARALTAVPSGMPWSASSPEGRSSARMGFPEPFIASITVLSDPSTGRVSPVPSNPSTSQSASAISALSGSGRASSADASYQVKLVSWDLSRIFHWVSASPRNSSRFVNQMVRVGKPQASRCRATTPPSPPLLPGPHRIRNLGAEESCCW